MQAHGSPNKSVTVVSEQSCSLDKMSWWSSMVSAISGDSLVDDEPQIAQSNPLSPPHPHAHMPTGLTSPNEFRSSSTPTESPIPSDSSASASSGYWSISSLKSTLAATSSSLTEVYKVGESLFYTTASSVTFRNRSVIF